MILAKSMGQIGHVFAVKANDIQLSLGLVVADLFDRGVFMKNEETKKTNDANLKKETVPPTAPHPISKNATVEEAPAPRDEQAP